MNTKRVNCAADVIHRALTQNRTSAGIATALESAGLLMSPEQAAELAAVHRSVDAQFPKVAEFLAEEPSLTVFRASHESIVMGLYTTAAEARKHCEAEERRSWPTGTNLAFDWIEDEDEEGGVAELVVAAGQNEESTTGYVVTPLTVASEYDEAADE